MADQKRVLITGASGLIGGVLRDAFVEQYTLSGVDIRPDSLVKSLCRPN